MTTHTETQLEEMLASRLSEFKTKMLEVADQALTAVHCELLPYVLSDADSNMSLLVQSCLTNILEGKFEVVEKFGYTYISVQDDNHYTHHITGYSQSLHQNAIQNIYNSALAGFQSGLSVKSKPTPLTSSSSSSSNADA